MPLSNAATCLESATPTHAVHNLPAGLNILGNSMPAGKDAGVCA